MSNTCSLSVRAGSLSLRSLCIASGLALGVGAGVASADGPLIKTKVNVESMEVCVTGPVKIRYSDGTIICVDAGGRYYLKKNATCVIIETKINPFDLPFMSNVLPAINASKVLIDPGGSDTQLAFDLPGYTEGQEVTEIVNISGTVGFQFGGWTGPVIVPHEPHVVPGSFAQRLAVRPIPFPSLGLPQFTFDIDVPPMDILGGQATTGPSKYVVDPGGVSYGNFTFGIDSRGRIVGSGTMTMDILFDSPNVRLDDGTDHGAPLKFRESSTVTFTIEVVNTTTGDLNADRVVDSIDLGMLLSHWGQAPDADGYLMGDVNEDGRVDASDLSLLLASWTPGG